MTTVEGKPCKTCGGTERYADSRNCISCRRVYIAQYRKKNYEKLFVKRRQYCKENQEKLRATSARYYKKHQKKILAKSAQYYTQDHGKARALWHAAKRRAKKAGVPFSITPEYLLKLIETYGRVCPALGTPFQSGVGKPIPESMTLDRFDARLGYVEGNVWLLSNKANSIKSDATRTEVGRVYRWMCKVMGEKE